MPSTEKTVNTIMIEIRLVLGPLVINKKRMLMTAVNIDKNPNTFPLFFLSKITTSLV